MITVTGKVVRILPGRVARGGEATELVVDFILADERDYWRVALWDDKSTLVTSGALQAGDAIRIENASPAQAGADGGKRLNAGSRARITRITTTIEPLREVLAAKLMVLAVARPERGKVCVAGIDEHGSWLRPQYVYDSELLATEQPLFRNRCISAVYLDTWHGRRARQEDRFFIYSRGVERELPVEEQKAFLEQHVDASVDAVFRSGRSLGLIKPRIFEVYEERPRREEKEHEQYIRFTFKDGSGRVYHRWPCRCADFYARWNSLKVQHRWTCGWRMRRYLKTSETYLAIGLTYTDYGRTKLEYGAYPLIVGVHMLTSEQQKREKKSRTDRWSRVVKLWKLRKGNQLNSFSDLNAALNSITISAC